MRYLILLFIVLAACKDEKCYICQELKDEYVYEIPGDSLISNTYNVTRTWEDCEKTEPYYNQTISQDSTAHSKRIVYTTISCAEE